MDDVCWPCRVLSNSAPVRSHRSCW